MKFGSLFAGIGGIDLGLERAGMECAWQVEIDDYCTRVLEKHWPDVTKYKDVKDVGKHNLEPVDLIAGGFPCQPHSVAGKRRGAADDRNLWPEFIRIVREVKPRYILGENVPGIITTYLDTVLSDLEGEGYTCTTFNIPACAFDAPHRRERIFVIAYRLGMGWKEGTSERVRSAEQQPKGQESQYIRKGISSERNVAHCQQPRLEGVEKPRGDGENRQESRDEYAGRRDRGIVTNWTVEPDVGRVAAGIPSRVDRLRGLGNAVVPQVAQYIGERILEHSKSRKE